MLNQANSSNSNNNNLGELTKELINALTTKPVNVLIIRSLCRHNPGLIASAGLRLQAWSILLLGNDYQNYLPSGNNNHSNLLHQQYEQQKCSEQHVLEADVHRTRADQEYFRSENTRSLIKFILQKFCLENNITYKQGMNEVLAPFLLINRNDANNAAVTDSNNNSSTNTYLIYLLYKAFLLRYLERFYLIDNSSFLFKSFRLFHLLLLYYDPQLANHLIHLDFTPEFYSTQWFLTFYARALPLPHVLRLWDMIIAIDDPAFIFFIGLYLLIKIRTDLLLCDLSNIPEIIASNISFKNEEEIDKTIKEAYYLYSNTPRCLLRSLRLCCVSNVELTPLPSSLLFNSSLFGSGSLGSSSTCSSSSPAPSLASTMKINVEEYDKLLSLQSVRNCFIINSQELIDSMLPTSHHVGSTSLSSSSSAHIPQQYVIIDIRSYEESVLSGGGIMPRAIQLEPEFLNQPEAFEVWLQHFDGTRGCNIIIIDLPSPQWTGINLWRRLLLGEGDGSKYSSLMERYEFNTFGDNKKRLDALIAHSKNISSSSSSSVHSPSHSTKEEPAFSGKSNSSNSNNNLTNDQIRDNDSKYYKDEENIIVSDLNSPAMLLAMVLQRNSFPNVSVLEGGFPALIDTLLTLKGKVEPIVVDHEPIKWLEFLRNTGRYQEKSNSLMNNPPKLTRIISDNNNDNNNGGGNSSKMNKSKVFKQEKDLTPLERYALALQVAMRLNHPEMKGILEDRIAELKKT